MGNFFGLLAGAGWGYSDYYGGHASRKMNNILLLLYTQIFSLPFYFLLLFVIPSVFSTNAILWGCAAGIGNIVCLLSLFEALSSERFSIVLPVSGVFSAMLPVVYALTLRNETLSLLVSAGMVAALFGVVLVSSASSAEFAPQKSATVHHLRGVFFAVLSGVGAGTVYICIAAASKQAGMWPLIASRIVVPILFVWTLIRRADLRISREGRRWAFIWMLFGSGAFVFFRLGVNHGNVAVVSVLAASSPVFTAILAWVIDHEHATRRQVIGVIVAGVGIALLNT